MAVALVTGAAAPDGIGAACARALAGDGFAVALLDREPCDEVADEIGGLALTADLRSDREATLAAVDECEARLGPCAVLVNNAADLTRGTLAETTPAQLRGVLAVNVEAAFVLCRRVAPGMAEQRLGPDRQRRLGHLRPPARARAWSPTSRARARSSG